MIKITVYPIEAVENSIWFSSVNQISLILGGTEWRLCIEWLKIETLDSDQSTVSAMCKLQKFEQIFNPLGLSVLISKMTLLACVGCNERTEWDGTSIDNAQNLLSI